MASISAWRSTAGSADGYLSIDKAVHTAQTIAEKSASIEIVRQGVLQDAQTVRVDPLSTPEFNESDKIRGSKARVLVLGYKDHPTIDDTDIQHSDRFVLNGQWYEVIQSYPEIDGRIEVVAEAQELGV